MATRIGQKSTQRQRTFFRQWREFRHLTQDQLAERIGTTKASISKIERGETMYGQASLEAWADALNCTPSDLISRDPNELPDIPVFDLPVGDKQRVFEFIRALRVTRVKDDGTPLPELPDTPQRYEAELKSRKR